MSILQEAVVAPVAKAPAAPSALWQSIEGRLNWIGDRLNPILVKETRQALKSKQFLITFSLVLLCSWLWSIGGAVIVGPEIYYSPSGPDMFIGYYFIMALPLLVVVPYGAYRSLASEREDRTYELLSITTLKPRQIISGKLASAMLQMIVYLSAVAPCLAFTYLLRGIDVLSILWFVFYTFLASLAFSVAALLIATITTQKHWQVLWTVAVVVGLAFAFMGSLAFVGEMASRNQLPVDDPEFWLVNLVFLTAYCSYFALLYLSAAAQLSFSTENRSTNLRIVMILQQALLVGWFGYFFLNEPETYDFRNEMLIAALIMLGIHWYAMGALMTGESPQLSHRVRRSLPQSQLGRAFLTWFNPGPATGYVFALSSAAAGLLLVAIAAILKPASQATAPFGRLSTDVVLQFGGLGLCYIAAYLGLGKLAISFVKRFTQVPLVAGVAIHAIILLTFCCVPYLLQLMWTDWRNDDYTLMQIFNPLWTLMEVVDNRNFQRDWATLLLVAAAAVLILLANLPGIAREMHFARVAKPKRVAEEDAEVAALHTPLQEPQPTSPWG